MVGFLLRPIRAVGPLVLAFLIALAIGSQTLLSYTGSQNSFDLTNSYVGASPIAPEAFFNTENSLKVSADFMVRPIAACHPFAIGVAYVARDCVSSWLSADVGESCRRKLLSVHRLTRSSKIFQKLSNLLVAPALPWLTA